MTMACHNLTATDGAGNVLAGASVEVRVEIPGQPLASIFSDRAGTTPLSNPTVTDSEGDCAFFCFGGAYKITVTLGALSKTRRYVPIGLNSESDSIAQNTQREVTAAGSVTIDADDDDIVIINKTVGAATAVTLPEAASRSRPVRIVDGKGDANTNNITISPQTGETIYAITNGTAIIDGNGGSVTLWPLADGSGWF